MYSLDDIRKEGSAFEGGSMQPFAENMTAYRWTKPSRIGWTQVILLRGWRVLTGPQFR